LTAIYIDADGCPVKDEVYRVAKRYTLPVYVVANSLLGVPDDPLVERVVVDDGFDAADDWIAERAEVGDIVITGDIPLADRCIKNGAAVLGHKGRRFTEDSIGEALATREFLSQMREDRLMSGGPAPFSSRDRSAFLQQLDALVHACRREANG
jgi:uncharacterized protein YaiI (UPF0178 family)